MADNSDGKIVLRLDKPKSIKQINDDIKKLEAQLSHLKATGGLDINATAKKINKQISSLQSQLKHIKLNANFDTTNAQRTGQKLGQAVADAAQSSINSNGINTDKLSADVKTSLTELAQAQKLDAEMQKTSNTVKSLNLKDLLSPLFNASTLLSRAATMARNGLNSVRELDTSLSDLKKTTSMSAKQLQEFYYDSNDIAKQMGVTTNAVIEQASAWSRLGFSSADAAARMSKLSSQFSSISPGMNVNDATTSLASIIKAYDIAPNDVLDGVMSKINDVGNKFAISNTEMADGLRNSSAEMAAVGGTLEDNIALFTAGQEIIQDASQVSNAIRSITLRIRGYDEETQALSDDLVDVSGKVADLTKVKSNDNHGISLFTDSTQKEFKSLVTYLGEISDIWDELDQKSKNDLLENLFGKNRAQVGAAILENFDTVRESLKVMEKSAGSADRELSIAMDSIDSKLNRLKETGTGIAQNLFGRQDMKTVLDIINTLGSGLDSLTEKIGLFGTLGLGGGLFASFKNVGKCRISVRISKSICFEYALHA